MWCRKKLSLTLVLSFFFSVLSVSGISAIWSAIELNSQSSQSGPPYLWQNTSWADSARREFLSSEGKERHRPYLESLEWHQYSASACLVAGEGPGWVVGQSTPHVCGTSPCEELLHGAKAQTWRQSRGIGQHVISTIPSEFRRFTSF